MFEKQLHTLLEKNGVSLNVIQQAQDLYSKTLSPELNTIPLDLYESQVDLSIKDTQAPQNNTNPHNSEEIRSSKQMIGRYENLGLLGKGGMGEVRKVRDLELNRSIAMKIIHPNLLTHNSTVARFIEEGQVGAQLQHPNIVPVHEIGYLDDGRLYFTMQEIKGASLISAINDVHRNISNNNWCSTKSGWSFRRLVDVFHKVCSAIAYAHSKGVIHRDLKPENIMIGPFGEVLVVDWGIAKIIGRPDYAAEAGDLDIVTTHRSSKNQFATQMGQVAGTPSYMPPEQAKGKIGDIDERSDIYALGGILYEILTGAPPYIGTSSIDVLNQVRTGPPASIRSAVKGKFNQPNNSPTSSNLKNIRLKGPPLPEELVEACERAMQRSKEERYQSVDELSTVILDWLEGAKKQARAFSVVMQARKTESKRIALKSEAAALRERAEIGLKDIPNWANEDIKAPYWRLEDKAASLETEADILSVRIEQLLKGALTHKSDLPEAHAELVNLYRQYHEESETQNDTQEALKSEVRLREHADALMQGHPTRIASFTYLKGTGALTIMANIEGSEFTLEKYETHNRRLTPKTIAKLGSEPVIKHSLEMGSYRVRIQKTGYHEALVPVFIGRREHWSMIPPEGGEPLPVPLLPLGSMDADDCYVPAGWFWSGGDKEATRGLPSHRLWIDGFVCKKFHITNQQYLVFLNDLLDQNREQEALQWIPQPETPDPNQQGFITYQRNKDGRFELNSSSNSPPYKALWPVMMIDHQSAIAYSKWFSERTNQDWRLPHELEWEKSARGVDARIYPWGNGFNPSFTHMIQSHKDKSQPTVVDSYPIDESPYGIRGLGGNIMEWTATPWLENGPDIVNGRISNTIPTLNANSDIILRGGAWNFNKSQTRAAFRYASLPNFRRSNRGFRILRSLSGL